MDRRVTPPKRVTSPSWGPPPPCKQALSIAFNVLVRNLFISFLQRPEKALDVLKEHQGLFLLT